MLRTKCYLDKMPHWWKNATWQNATRKKWQIKNNVTSQSFFHRPICRLMELLHQFADWKSGRGCHSPLHTPRRHAPAVKMSQKTYVSEQRYLVDLIQSIFVGKISLRIKGLKRFKICERKALMSRIFIVFLSLLWRWATCKWATVNILAKIPL